MPSDTDLEHEYDLRDLLKDEYLDEVWKVINRMVDVDREELLYRLQLVSPQGPRHGNTQIWMEEKLHRDSSEWTYVESENGHLIDGATSRSDTCRHGAIADVYKVGSPRRYCEVTYCDRCERAFDYNYYSLEAGPDAE